MGSGPQRATFKHAALLLSMLLLSACPTAERAREGVVAKEPPPGSSPIPWRNLELLGEETVRVTVESGDPTCYLFYRSALMEPLTVRLALFQKLTPPAGQDCRDIAVIHDLVVQLPSAIGDRTVVGESRNG